MRKPLSEMTELLDEEVEELLADVPCDRLS